MSSSEPAARASSSARVTADWLTALVRDFPGAEAGVKPEWDVCVLSVEGKIFGLFSENSGEQLLTLKGDPLENEALRQTYPEVIPGYHMNKRHWNSVRLGVSSLPLDHVSELVEASYDLVFASLTKRLQRELRERHVILRAQ